MNTWQIKRYLDIILCNMDTRNRCRNGGCREFEKYENVYKYKHKKRGSLRYRAMLEAISAHVSTR